MQRKFKVYGLSLFMVLTLLLSACTATQPAEAPAQQPAEVQQAAAVEAPAESPAMKDIATIAAEDERFETLVTALTEAGLVETLQGEGPFTVFAPTDEAFAALPEGTVEGLLADKPALTDVLLYHVVPGKVMAADVTNLESAETVMGQPVNITTEDGMVKVGEATVVLTDIEAANGVIHVIDSVLIPGS